MGVKERGTGGGKKRKRKGDHPRPKQHEQMKKPAGNGSIDLELLDCTICMNPLRPPIFQCAVGHVICASCHGSLPNKDRCHTCKTTGGYNRCVALEKILESFCVPCSNAKHGCTAKMRYHEAEKHGKSCLHAPCSCPETGCRFTGSTVKLPGSSHWRSQVAVQGGQVQCQVHAAGPRRDTRSPQPRRRAPVPGEIHPVAAFRQHRLFPVC
ncbi:hypothetical protein ACQ4PT_044735 [Festuca glaucescens]